MQERLLDAFADAAASGPDAVYFLLVLRRSEHPLPSAPAYHDEEDSPMMMGMLVMRGGRGRERR